MMQPVDNDVVEKISRLARELPKEQALELLALIDHWKKNERLARRERYIELLDFSSKNGSHHGHAKDVSASGIFIESSGNFEMGENIQLVLTFISAPNPVRIRGTIVRLMPTGIGVSFDLNSQSQKKLMDTIIKKHGQIMDH